MVKNLFTTSFSFYTFFMVLDKPLLEKVLHNFKEYFDKKNISYNKELSLVSKEDAILLYDIKNITYVGDLKEQLLYTFKIKTNDELSFLDCSISSTFIKIETYGCVSKNILFYKQLIHDLYMLILREPNFYIEYLFLSKQDNVHLKKYDCLKIDKSFLEKDFDNFSLKKDYSSEISPRYLKQSLLNDFFWSRYNEDYYLSLCSKYQVKYDVSRIIKPNNEEYFSEEMNNLNICFELVDNMFCDVFDVDVLNNMPYKKNGIMTFVGGLINE